MKVAQECYIGSTAIFTLLYINVTDPLKNLFQIIYTNSVPTSQETHYVSATNINQVILSRDITAVYCEKHWKTEIHSVGRMQSFSMLKQ
jgi:hypothetical protein